MIRALRPTDLGAFLSFRARAPANEALLGPARRSPRMSLREFLSRSLAIDPNHETWVQIEHGQVFGLASARARFGADVWDVDYLMVAPAIDEDRVCQRLLDHLCEAAVEEGVIKVFLRLRSGSPWLQAAHQVGFVHYTSERVFVLPQFDRAQRPTVPGLRPRRPADHQALFQLYTATVPARVRQIEALTLQEWRWNDNWGVTAVAPLRSALQRRRRDLIVQNDGRPVAWLQVHLRARTLQMLVDHRDSVEPSVLLGRGLAELPSGGPVTFAVRDYQPELVEALEERGFREVESHALLARVLAVRIPERRLVPARVV